MSKPWKFEESDFCECQGQLVFGSSAATRANAKLREWIEAAPPKQQAPKEALEHIATIELNEIGPKVEKAPEKKPVKNYAPGARY